MKKIYISKSISHYISIPQEISEMVNICENIIEEIAKILADKNTSPLYTIIFINHSEYDRIHFFLKEFNYSDIIYRIIVIDPDGIYNLTNADKLKDISSLRTSKVSEKEFIFLSHNILKQAQEFYNHKKNEDKFIMQLMDTQQDQEDLINIGKSLTNEKDPDKLLRIILFLSKRITGADAGSIHLIEENEKGKQLRFKYSHTFSKEIPVVEFVMPYDKNSIAGYVAVTGEVLNIPDVYELSKNDPVSFNSSVDEKYDYHSKSMLVVPMRNHIDEIIGVIQLINSKEDTQGSSKITGNEAFEIKLVTAEDYAEKVVPFEKRYEGLMEAVASQFAIALENNRMIRQIETQFEEFVKASVNAIESRDIATSGHSFRVAEICKEMARAVNAENNGVYGDISFSDSAVKELEYAALLHDFGKVYIDVAIFMKGKKLFPKDFEYLMLKFNYLYKLTELQYSLNQSKLLNPDTSGNSGDSMKEQLICEKEKMLTMLKTIIDRICILNEPTITEKDPKEILNEIVSEIIDIKCMDIQGNRIQILDEQERMNLEIKRGSLNPVEREVIESHVVHTYNFVSKIPWPPEYKNIPEIALKHHEKLDGTGYPFHLTAKDIPIQSRMMAIADIYDALTASDRPYKKAMPLEKALAILKEEAENNKIDKDLLDIFLKYKIYEKIDRNSFKQPAER